MTSSPSWPYSFLLSHLLYKFLKTIVIIISKLILFKRLRIIINLLKHKSDHIFAGKLRTVPQCSFPRLLRPRVVWVQPSFLTSLLFTAPLSHDSRRTGCPPARRTRPAHSPLSFFALVAVLPRPSEGPAVPIRQALLRPHTQEGCTA